MTLKSLNSYIDACLIDEYADKDLSEGYTLDIDNLPSHEVSNFLDRCMQEDTAIRDFVLNTMQKMIDARLPDFESQDRFQRGQRVVRLSNGDQFVMRGAA